MGMAWVKWRKFEARSEYILSLVDYEFAQKEIKKKKGIENLDRLGYGLKYLSPTQAWLIPLYSCARPESCPGP